MIEFFTNYAKDFSFTNWMGIGLYWVPLSLCVYGYTVRTWLNYQRDVKERDFLPQNGFSGYRPTDTVGTLIGRAIVSMLPIANLWAAAFDVAPRLFSSLFKWIEKVFDQPLVPKRKPPKEPT